MTVLLPFANFTDSHGSPPSTVELNSLDPTPTGTVNYLVSFLDPLAALETKYAFTSQDGYFNDRGQNEKYLLSTNGHNSAGDGYYVLMPNGNVYAFVPGVLGLESTLDQSPVFSVAPSVYANPALLTGNTGSPIVTSGTNPLYNLKIQYGLANPVIPADFNARQSNEQYLLSTNGSNPSGGGYFVLMPDNKLYAWQGSLAANQLVADFNVAPYAALGNVYANPTLLTSAVLPTAVGVTAATTTASGGILTLTAAAGFDRALST